MTQSINVAQVIDGQKVGGLQIRAFLLCCAVLFVDGFDVQGITYVAPAISQEWGLQRGALGPTFSAGLFGVMLGALLLAPLADRIGRRRVIIWSCVAFGACTLVTPLMSNLTELLPLRFLTGLGLGAALPNAIGLASEYAPQKRRASIVMFVSSGISLGSIGVGIVAARLISTLGWEAVFIVGGVLPLLLAAALFRWLPESIRFAALIPGREAEAKRLLRQIKPDLPRDEDLRLQSNARRRQCDSRRPFPEGLGRATRADLDRVLHEPAERLSRDQLAAHVAERVRLHADASGGDHHDVSRRRRARHVCVRPADGPPRRALDADLRVPARRGRLLDVRDVDRTSRSCRPRLVLMATGFGVSADRSAS